MTGAGIEGSIVAELVQGIAKNGPAAILALVIFLIYRKDSLGWALKVADSAEAYMKFGQSYASALTRVAEQQTRQTEIQNQHAVILERIEQHLSGAAICPVSRISSDLVREVTAPRAGGPASRAGVAGVLLEALTKDAGV